MKKILFYSEGWGLGGIETFIMNTIREMPRDQYKCDIFCTHDWSTAHDEELKLMGVQRYCVFSGFKPNQLRRLITSSREFRKLLREKKYDVVHICTMNGMGFFYSNIAFQEHVPVRVVHSHNSDFGEGHRRIKAIFHNMGKLLWKRTATHLVACSSAAGQYLFDSAPYLLLPNGLDTSRYRYNAAERAQLRNDLRIPEDAVCIGAIGRISEVKQPFFQVDILMELRRLGMSAFLLLVGSGPLESAVRDYVDAQGLADFVRLPGSSGNPSGYYSVLDALTMPSLFEGMPIALIEAASSGLPCFTSDNIPNLPYPLECIQSVHSNRAEDWASILRKVLNIKENRLRDHAADIVNDAGYSIKSMVEKLVVLYQG